ncbi:MAG: GNAT family N-acetyltransferase [Myxococcales bacterium]|nr:GNAT family N-acetyltransferase [Myxococcales bacterium]MDD9969040.1 GNAT family N-acetyltransferase [Myxococcales bacterium]
MATAIRPVQPIDPAVLALLRALNEHNRSHYDADRCRWASVEDLSSPDTTMLGAFFGDELVGVGAIALEPGYAEIKRMFVVPHARGYGVGADLLEALLDIARRAGRRCARLETGERFEAAVALYRRFGFCPCQAFGPYRANPANMYMELAFPPEA